MADLMHAMVLHAARTPLVPETRPLPVPAAGEVLIGVEACAVCRTDLHVVDGDLPDPRLPLIPGHEIVGRVLSCGPGADPALRGQRVGVPWLGRACSQCSYCRDGRENLCDAPEFTGYTRDGGFATHAVADAAFLVRLGDADDPVATAPLLCAGLIGWRTLRMAGSGLRSIGIYGFGAAAHLITQVCTAEGCAVHAFTRDGDTAAQTLARDVGAVFAAGSSTPPPRPLDAALIFAPDGTTVPQALRAVRKGGRVVCGGIHMSDIPAFPYRILWEERQLVSVANVTRADAVAFFPAARAARVTAHTTTYRLAEANRALDDLRAGRLSGAAVLLPD